MEHQKLLNLLNETNDSKFVTRKWNIVNDNWKTKYNTTNEINYNTEISKSNLCHYNDAYVLVTDNITVVAAPATQVAFKNYVPFTKCITKIDETTIDDAENLQLVMPMYNLTEYSSNYSKTTKVYGFIQKMKQLILMQILLMMIILSLLKIGLNHWETQLIYLLQMLLIKFWKNRTIAVPLK